MKLTEKELYDLPLGSKAIKGKNEYLKIRNNEWEKQYVGYAYSNNEMALLADKILIPTTYTEYIPPKLILDEKEKKYLSYVIRPFKDKIANIHKTGYKKVYEFIVINIPEDSDIAFPNFDAGTMYKGMELNKEYSLEELGL